MLRWIRTVARTERRVLARVVLTGVGFALSVGGTLGYVFSLGGPGGEAGVAWASAMALAGAIVGFYFAAGREGAASRREARQVFIAYSHEDREAAEQLASSIKRAGYRPWLDTQELTPGVSIDEAIRKAIRESGLALYVAPSDRESPWLRAELEALSTRVVPAVKGATPVIPVVSRYDQLKELPQALAGISALALEDDEWERKLALALRRSLGPAPVSHS